jgi:dTDP-4-dehydrorhamnose 3,5-epimerase
MTSSLRAIQRESYPVTPTILHGSTSSDHRSGNVRARYCDDVRFTPMRLAGAWIVDLERRVDERGSFARTFCEEEFAAHGLPTHFPQANLSSNSVAGTMRGMHLNVAGHEEGKFVRCTRGAVYDVIVDLRQGSPTHLEHVGLELDADTGTAVFVPEGFAHAFITLVDSSDVSYLMTRSYEPGVARGFRWDDPAFAIQWPRPPTVIAERDATYPDFSSTALGS